jgi:transketolase
MYDLQEIKSRILEERNKNRRAELLGFLAQHFRTETFKMIHKRGNGHWGGSSSATELLTTLYFGILNISPEDPLWSDRDRLILSKGHAAPVLYGILADLGYFPKDELENFRSLNSILQGHPCMQKTPGVDMSTGPLGHGVSVGTGMALAANLLKKEYKTYVLIGDGDLNEGVSWEGFLSASKYKPPRLIFLIDYNKVQLDGPSAEIMPLDSLPDKLNAFNIKVAPRSYDGHSVAEILESFEWIEKNHWQPVAVIYNTIKGKGISFTENNYKWHGAPIDDLSFEKGIAELLTDLEQKGKIINDRPKINA